MGIPSLLLLLVFLPMPIFADWKEGDAIDNTTTFFPWTAFFGLGAMTKMLDEWKLKCYKTGDDGKLIIEQCEVACVIMFKMTPMLDEKRATYNYRNTTTYHCQDLDTYPLNYHWVCSSSEKEFPNRRKYFHSLELVKAHLYCCNTPLCNSPDVYMPIEAQSYKQKEQDDMIHFHRSIFVSAYLCIALLIAWPFMLIWKKTKEDEWLQKALVSKMERAVILMESKRKVLITKKTEIVTGHLTFDQYLSWFRLIQHYQPVKKTKRHLVLPTQDTIEILEYKAGGNGHDLVCADRKTWVRYADVQQVGRANMQTVLEHGPYAYDWKPINLVELFDQAKELFHANDVLVEITFPVVVIGSIRGHYQDLWRWLQLVGVPPRRKLLFLGGLIDPEEPGSLDCLALISTMKVAFPQHVFLLRGVTESMKINFGHRYGAANDRAIRSAASRLCAHLPIASRIHLRVLAVHSGISHLLTDFESFHDVRRPFDLETMPVLARQLIFNEPTSRVKMYREGKDKIGHFGFQAVSRLCKEAGFNYIIRSRHHVEDGIMWNERGRLISLWSAPGKVINKEDGRKPTTARCGAILLLDSEGKQKVIRLNAQ